MTKPVFARLIIQFLLLFFAVSLLFSGCKKDAARKQAGPACYDYMTIDSNMSFPEAAYANYYYYNNLHQLIRHVVTSGGAVAWSDTFAYDHGHVVKSWMSLGSNSFANYYTRNEYDYNDTLMNASRYYLGNKLIVHSAYTYDTKGRLASYAQHSDNTSLQTDGNYIDNLVYDNNDNLTELTDQYGNVKARYGNYDDKPNVNYKMPYDWAYDIFSYFNPFSKHNVGVQHFYTYNAYTAKTDTSNHTFTYTYANGKVATEIIDGSVLMKLSSLCK